MKIDCTTLYSSGHTVLLFHFAQCYWFHWDPPHCPHSTVHLSLTLHFALLLQQQSFNTSNCTVLIHTLWLQCNVFNFYCFAVKHIRVFRFFFWKHSAVVTDKTWRHFRARRRDGASWESRIKTCDWEFCVDHPKLKVVTVWKSRFVCSTTQER